MQCLPQIYWTHHSGVIVAALQFNKLCYWSFVGIFDTLPFPMPVNIDASARSITCSCEVQFGIYFNIRKRKLHKDLHAVGLERE